MFGIPLHERLSTSVGDGRKNKEEDVIRVKDRLDDMGYLKEKKKDRHGFITRDMDDAIRRFQKDHGLKTDGWMKPGG